MTIPATILVFGIGGLGTTEILLILGVLLFFFGAKKIPEIARGLGKSVNEFKKGQNENLASKEEPQSPPPPQERL